MRIAFFYNLPSGGAKRTIYEQVKRLSHNHEIDVYTFNTAGHEFADIRPYVKEYRCFEYHFASLLPSPFGRLNQAIRLSDLWRMGRQSKMIAHSILSGSYELAFVHPCQVTQGPIVLQHLKKLPAVYYLHEAPRAIYEKRPLRPFYKNNGSRFRSTLNRVDPLLLAYNTTIRKVDYTNTRSAKKVLVNSRFMSQVVKDIYHIDPLLSYHGVDAEKFRVLPIEKRDMILSVGSLTPLKGFDFLIQSIAHIPKEERPPLVIASNFQMPEEKSYLEGMAAGLGVELILFNNVSDEVLVNLYNSARLTVYSPIREPFGLVTLESMACGTPVVTVREGGVQEAVIHEQTGLIVERDPAQFAEAVRRLLSQPELCLAYGRNGREHVLQNWTWDRAIEGLEEVLLMAVSSRSHPSQ
jgi:glycosyltransferase involved in cell wall biosynthesis